MPQEVIDVLAQLGASSVFALAIVVIATRFYQHYEAEVLYLRAKVDELEKIIIQLENEVRATKSGSQPR